MKKFAFGILFLCCGLLSCSHSAQVADYRVVPLPQDITTPTGDAFVLSEQTNIVYPKDNAVMERNADFLAEYIKEKTNLTLTATTGERPKAITLAIGDVSSNKEGYKLTVNADGITITGASEAGVFYGIQTLRKSLPVVSGGSITMPAVEINDYPRFAYRGTHLDVSRHFCTADSVKRFIDMLALHNMNRFHWHLTDDQGWRIEIKKYPKLAEVGGYRNETVIGRNTGVYDGIEYGPYYYTQEECRDIVKYAAERHITIIPEIDLPGHMQAALAAYPEYGCTGGPYEVWKMWGVSDNVLCAGNDATLKFIEDVLTEVIDVFPSEFIHVGGDECPKDQWKKCPKCQARIKKLGIKGDDKHSAEMYLQSFVISHAEKFLNSKGRNIIGWDEILEGGLAPNATVHSWRGLAGGLEAAKQGHNCIMSPNDFLYFDYYQTKYIDDEPLCIGGYVPVEKVYSFEPLHESLTPEQQKYIIGVQANIWTEYMPDYKRVEYMALPRMAALCEVQWCKPENKDYEDFKTRLLPLIDLYDIKGYNYAKHLFEVFTTFSTDTVKNCVKVNMSTIDNAPIYYTLDGSEPTTASARYEQPVEITEACTLKAKGISSTRQTKTFTENIIFNKATARSIKLLQPTNQHYNFDGPLTLIDGLVGSPNYRTGRWLGFSENDFEALIDLGQSKDISSVAVNTSVNKEDWVFGARGFQVSVSEDDKEYKEVAKEDYPQMAKEDADKIYTHELKFAPTAARYVKVKVLVESSMPAWHGAAGKRAFIFVDEVRID